jgi:hypothetical protein
MSITSARNGIGEQPLRLVTEASIRNGNGSALALKFLRYAVAYDAISDETFLYTYITLPRRKQFRMRSALFRRQSGTNREDEATQVHMRLETHFKQFREEYQELRKAVEFHTAMTKPKPFTARCADDDFNIEKCEIENPNKMWDDFHADRANAEDVERERARVRALAERARVKKEMEEKAIAAEKRLSAYAQDPLAGCF